MIEDIITDTRGLAPRFVVVKAPRLNRFYLKDQENGNMLLVPETSPRGRAHDLKELVTKLKAMK